MEVPPLGSGEGGAPVASRSHPCSIRTPSVLLLLLLLLAGRHANGERRRRAGEGAPGLPLPSTGGAWRCLRQGAVRVAPPLPVGATPAPFGLRRCSCCRCCCWRGGTPTGNGVCVGAWWCPACHSPPQGSYGGASEVGLWRWLFRGRPSHRLRRTPPPPPTALLAGRHANGERRRRAGGRAPGLPAPSTGGAWRCLEDGAVELALLLLVWSIASINDFHCPHGRRTEKAFHPTRRV